MSKKLFFKESNDVIKKAIEECNAKGTEINKVIEEIKSGKYTPDTIRNELNPKKNRLNGEINTIQENAIKAVNDNIRDYFEKVDRRWNLMGDEINEDAKLLNAGVKLTNSDIDALMQRNADNNTMLRLICDYAEQNNIRIENNGAHIKYYNDMNSKDRAEAMSEKARVALRFYYQPDVYNRLLGEETEYYNYFNEE